MKFVLKSGDSYLSSFGDYHYYRQVHWERRYNMCDDIKDALVFTVKLVDGELKCDDLPKHGDWELCPIAIAAIPQ